MDDPTYLPAVFRRRPGYVYAEIGALLDHPRQEVWSALTDPETLARWLAPGSIEPWRGGAARLDFVDSGIAIDSRVSDCEAPRLLEFSWSGPGEPVRPLLWELEPAGEGCRLRLVVGVPEGEDAARAAAGFAAHIEMLMATLAGASVKFPFAVFKAAREAYGRQLGEAALA